MFYTVKQIAELLGLSQAQIYGHIEDGTLKAHRFTRKRTGAIRVSQAQLDEFLAATEITVPEDTPTPEPPPQPRKKPSGGGLDLW